MAAKLREALDSTEAVRNLNVTLEGDFQESLTASCTHTHTRAQTNTHTHMQDVTSCHTEKRPHGGAAGKVEGRSQPDGGRSKTSLCVALLNPAFLSDIL